MTVTQAKRLISEPVGSAILNDKCTDSRSQLFVPKRQERRKEGMPLRHVWKFENLVVGILAVGFLDKSLL